MSGASLTERLKGATWVARTLRRNPIAYWQSRRVLEHLAAADAGELAEAVASRLSRELKRAKGTPYGQQHGGAQLSDWPILEKSRVRGHESDFYRNGLRPHSVGHTSGTTGTPIVVHRSIGNIAFERAAIDLAFLQVGLDPMRMRYAVLRGAAVKDVSDMTPPFWVSADGGRGLTLSGMHISASTAPLYAQALRDHRIECIIGYPSAIHALAGHLESQGESVPLRLVMTHAEVALPEVRELVSRVFCCPTLDEYGQAERVARSYSYEVGIHRFVPGYSCVELLPVDGDEARVCEVVGTSFCNAAMSLVRYRTGDTIELLQDADPDHLQRVALGIEPFKRVIGREPEYLIAPNGTRLVGITLIPWGVANLIEAQVVQLDQETVEIRVVVAQRWSEADEEHLVANARLRIPEQMQIRIVPVERLERSASGKTPYVIRHASVHDDLAVN